MAPVPRRYFLAGPIEGGSSGGIATSSSASSTSPATSVCSAGWGNAGVAGSAARRALAVAAAWALLARSPQNLFSHSAWYSGGGDAVPLRSADRGLNLGASFLALRCTNAASQRAAVASAGCQRRAVVAERGAPTLERPAEPTSREQAINARLAEFEEQLEDARDGPGEAEALYRLGIALRKVSDRRSSKAERRRDAERAFDSLLEAAQLGYGKAQYVVGTMLVKGQGVETDLESAKYFLYQAAESGLDNAQHAMGLLHYSGALSEDGQPDLMGAAFWMKKAADSGHTEAQYRIAGMLLSSDGIVRNETWAAEYYLKAAESGHVQSQGKYGLLLRGGVGVEQDGRAAARWLRRAAEAGDPQACYALGCMFRKGEGVVPKNPKAALYWFTMAGDEGHLEAAHDLAVMYMAGEGTEPDEEGAAYWFMLADAVQQDLEGGLDFEEEEEWVDEEAAYADWHGEDDDDDDDEDDEDEEE